MNRTGNQSKRFGNPRTITRGLFGLTQPADYHGTALTQLGSSPDQFFEQLEVRLNILELYQAYFPTRYQNSSASAVFVGAACHTEKELEFFGLIDEFKFPYDRDSVDFEPSIQLWSLNLNWFETDWSELGLLTKCLTVLINYTDWEEFLKELKLENSGIEAPLPIKQINQEQLKTNCETAPRPVNWLYKSLEILDHSTGNIWLDSGEEDLEWYEWDYKNIEYLTDQYNQARPWIEGFDQLSRWVEEKPERLQYVIKLWNSAGETPDTPYRQLELPLITTVSSTDFVRGQWLREFRAQHQRFQYLAYS